MTWSRALYHWISVINFSYWRLNRLKINRLLNVDTSYSAESNKVTRAQTSQNIHLYIYIIIFSFKNLLVKKFELWHFNKGSKLFQFSLTWCKNTYSLLLNPAINCNSYEGNLTIRASLAARVWRKGPKGPFAPAKGWSPINRPFSSHNRQKKIAQQLQMFNKWKSLFIKITL